MTIKVSKLFLPAGNPEVMALEPVSDCSKLKAQLGARHNVDKVKKARGKLARVPSVHFRSASGRVTKPLPDNYFAKNQDKERIKKELLAIRDEYGLSGLSPGLLQNFKGEEGKNFSLSLF